MLHVLPWLAVDENLKFKSIVALSFGVGGTAKNTGNQT